MKNDSTLLLIGIAIAAYLLLKPKAAAPDHPNQVGGTTTTHSDGSVSYTPPGGTFWEDTEPRPYPRPEHEQLPASGFYDMPGSAAAQANQFADWVDSIQLRGHPHITGVIHA